MSSCTCVACSTLTVAVRTRAIIERPPNVELADLLVGQGRISRFARQRRADPVRVVTRR